MQTRYGEISSHQIASAKKLLQSSIFFLLLIVDPKTKHEYPTVDKQLAFKNVILKLRGMNSLFFEPVEVVTIMEMLESARLLLDDMKDVTFEEFKKSDYRKLILDAGSEVDKIKEV